MKTFFVLTALGEILMLVALYLAGRRHVLAGLRKPYRPPEQAQPDESPPAAPAAMVVPITGDTEAVRAGLESLLAQDYPNLRYVFVTRDESDPATPLVRSLVAGRDDAEHVLSGPAARCGQKNHNLLAGVARVSQWASVYVFCDSTHVARPDLVRLLVAPLADGRAVISGGFHRVVPLDAGIPTLGLLNVCLVLHCLQSIRAITQPWGGAMAVTRQAFEEHGVATVWESNIVDDFSLGPLLAKRRIRSWPVAEACLDTPLEKVTLSYWQDWLTRQLLYLKFCTPEMWLGAVVVVLLFAAPPLMGGLGVLGALTGAADGWWIAAFLAWAAGLAGAAMLFRGLSPRPVGVADWLKAYFITSLVTAWCYLRTWTTFTMRWRGIAYKVTWGGRVVEVIRN